MPFSAALADRVRHALRDQRGTIEKKMFGGVGFLLHGNMCVGIWGAALIARVGAEAYPAALKLPHVSEFNVTGRSMTGWVLVDPDGIDSERQLREWLDRAIAFVSTLPPK